MLGFLFKVLLVVAIVVGILTFVGVKRGYLSLSNLPHDLSTLSFKNLPMDIGLITNIKSQVAGVSGEKLSENLSGALDSLVTHANKNSPIVLGVKVTNESVGAVTDALMSLPSDKLDQIKNALCAPASNSGTTP